MRKRHLGYASFPAPHACVYGDVTNGACAHKSAGPSVFSAWEEGLLALAGLHAAAPRGATERGTLRDHARTPALRANEESRQRGKPPRRDATSRPPAHTRP